MTWMSLWPLRVRFVFKARHFESSIILLCVRQSKYMNNRIEQDHRRIKRRTRPMLGFKSARSAAIILDGIELIHMIRKGQMLWPEGQNLSLADQFSSLAA